MTAIWAALRHCWAIPDADAQTRQHLLNRQLRPLFLIIPILSFANCLSAIWLIAAIGASMPTVGVAAWCVVFFLCEASWSGHALNRLKAGRADRPVDYTSGDLKTTAMLCGATALWCGIGLYLSTPRIPDEAGRILIIAVVPGLIAAGVLASITVPLVSAVWLGILVLVSCITAFELNYVNQDIGVAFMLLYAGLLASAALLISRMFVGRVQAELESERERRAAELLAADLRRQKEIAEQANQAKSRFLAAASHDLRQPVHALSLFVGALRNVPMPAEGRRLVEQIDASTSAMDMLFAALLDISKLDAGVVAVDRRAFPIDPVLARVCRDYAGDAQAKGLVLSHVRSRVWVDSDPTLVERIARNLVANAVRYTDVGRVVVGCRRRGGRVAMQVWDTGRGIPKSQQGLVFQEYYQLDNPERDRNQGLGLGLAIVRRLTVLLGSTIRLRSTPGRGSCFEVSFAQASVVCEPPAAPVAAGAAGATAELVVVIDDEAAIRMGMSILLSGWGYDVVTAGSADEAIVRLAAHPRRPGLLLCDVGLHGGETGIDAIQRLRNEYNETIPAMLISGDTAADRLREVQASELMLLHKPVPNDRLRRAIAQLLALEVEPE
ncbi:ATP-binding response regulator [Burkholderia alba]|uniref:ATP-binding response regulator n=1 Tax=Burkholderia alba TaxID=2683677 RepID=UPI002B05F283|nr:hybrid sensor histidine kinase/response regulator [Burkholderia alba]